MQLIIFKSLYLFFFFFESLNSSEQLFTGNSTESGFCMVSIPGISIPGGDPGERVSWFRSREALDPKSTKIKI